MGQCQQMHSGITADQRGTGLGSGELKAGNTSGAQAGTYGAFGKMKSFKPTLKTDRLVPLVVTPPAPSFTVAG